MPPSRMNYVGRSVIDINARTGKVLERKEDRYLVEWEDGKVKWYGAWLVEVLVKNMDSPLP